MELNVAINALLAVMMAIFPGFLFRKCFFRGEFTKQFYQSKDVDKLLWNVFFSGLGILVTLIFISIFKQITGLKILASLNYQNINKIIVSITANQLPEEEIVNTTYVDILTIISLIYFFSAFFGILCHWVVRVFRLDIRFPIFRFKNYWYYYIHGGRILYGNYNNRKYAFTIADILCDHNGELKLYKGIISQYTINRDDNNLENIFLTEARVLNRIKDSTGKTIDIEERAIPGASFFIPYRNVLNMNLFYVFSNEKPKAFDQFFIYTLNIIILILFIFSSVLLFFDLKDLGIVGFWEKTWCLFFTLIGLANLRLIILQFIKLNTSLSEWLSPILTASTCIFWILYFMGVSPLWPAVSTLVLAICTTGLLTDSKEQKKSNRTSS